MRTSVARMIGSKEYEEAIKETSFYSLLEKIPLQKVPLDLKTVQLTILELSDDRSHKPEDEKYIFDVIQTSFRMLIREKRWTPEYATNFSGKLHRLNTLNTGKKNTARIVELVDALLAARFLSKKTEKYMDSLTFEKQFGPIECLVRNIKETAFDKAELDRTTLDAFAEVAIRFFTEGVQKSSEEMSAWSRTFMGAPIYNSLLLSLFVPKAGIGEFKDMTFSTRHIYEDGLREYILSSEANGSMQVIVKGAKISGKESKVSFGWIVEREKILIRTITTSFDLSQDSSQEPMNDDSETFYKDPCFFAETVLAPQAPPNAHTSFDTYSLYTIKQVPNSTYSKLVEVAEETREQIILLIKEIQIEINQKLKKNYPTGCEMHTIIKINGEPVHVATLIKSGLQLNGRALDGNIRTYLKQEDDKEFKKRVYEAIAASHVGVAIAHVKGWYQVKLLEPLIASYYPSINESATMTLIKKHTLMRFNREDKPGGSLLSSIIACNTQGNPNALAPLDVDDIHESNKPTIQFEPCKALLNAALKTTKAEIYLPLIESMVNGIHAMMKRSKTEKLIDDLQLYFKPLKEELPKEKITSIMSAKEKLYQKAARCVHLFFTQKLGVEATEVQMETIQDHLNKTYFENLPFEKKLVK